MISQAKYNTKDTVVLEKHTEEPSLNTTHMQIEESSTHHESMVQDIKKIGKVLETEPSRRSDRQRKPKHFD
jgi:hypothetical protein